MRTAIFAGLLLGSPAPPPKPVIEGGYVDVAPGIMALPFGTGPGDTARRALRYAYVWSAGGGFHFEPIPRLVLGIGGAIEHQIHIYEQLEPEALCFQGACYDEEGQGGLVRAQIDGRIGVAGRWFFTFVEVSPSVDLLYVRLRCKNEREPYCDTRERDIGPGIGTSLAFYARPTERAGIGVEGGLDFVRFGAQDDPFRSVHTFDLLLLLQIRL